MSVNRERKRPFSLEFFKLNKYSSLDGGGGVVLSSGQKCT